MKKTTLNHIIFILLINFIFIPVHAESYKGMHTAKGFGTVNINKTNSKFQAKMMARRAAELDAQRQLTETTKGLQISTGTTVEDFEVTSDVIATRVKGLLKGAFVIKETIKPEENTFVAEVTLAIRLTNESERCRNRDSIKLISESTNVQQ